MIPIFLGAVAGFLATLVVLATAYRLLGWWREVPLDGEDFRRISPREWDQIQAEHDSGPGVTSPAPGPGTRLNGEA